MSSRIRHWRKRRRMTLEQLASRLGTSAGHLHKWETGKVSVNLKRMGEIADILGIGIVDLVKDLPRVPILGKVGAGAVVESIDDFPLGEAQKYARCPTGLDPQYTVAVEVVGDSMLPIDEGWLLFYTRSYDGIPSECLGKLCVVQLSENGPRYVKRLKQGKNPSLFNLYSTNAREIEDVELAWAAPVLDARPSEPGELIEEPGD
ncbi:MAG: helix-turn-helix domain-containing protein [Alphaproteobacteria bacterium]|nr:helix-turn-helix domain-containing protein [Alphaproteobacteria bacterium]